MKQEKLGFTLFCLQLQLTSCTLSNLNIVFYLSKSESVFLVLSYLFTSVPALPLENATKFTLLLYSLPPCLVINHVWGVFFTLFNAVTFSNNSERCVFSQSYLHSCTVHLDIISWALTTSALIHHQDAVQTNTVGNKKPCETGL